ncbi:hypothetical protein RN001_006603 [Aquatica leii]|uniref:Uncharacterized protein n=1 Tax=Aquatica leii TaxID=1421715 RepID=A0AAN7PDW0_9COLE|nr:hypothetical protein RN001_006603 [Aquatica leii]
MRFPHIINENTKDEYEASVTSLNLKLEQNRKVHSEDLKWGDDHVPSLAMCCVKAISKNFEKHPVIHKVSGADKDYLIEILSTKLPLELVIPLINIKLYWKRRFQDEFGLLLQRKHEGWTWKQLYIERYIRKILEEAEPQYQDEENFGTITKLCRPYVKHLIITQLQRWIPPLTMLQDEHPEYWPIDHIDFTSILKELTEIEEFSISIGMNSVREKFCWDMFKFTELDCSRISSSFSYLKNLKILRFHRCKMEDSQCRALLRGCITNNTLIELDLSHCAIGDQGALCVAKLMTVHPTLETVKLNDNKIQQVGAEGIGFALLQENCCPIIRLEIQENTLGHTGIMGLLRSLVRSDKPIELSIAACMAEGETPLRIAQMLAINSTLEVLDLSSNWFGEEGGDLLINYLKYNKTIKWLDLRETDITSGQYAVIQKILRRNRNEDDNLDDEEEELENEDADLAEHETEAGSQTETEESDVN